ncbi:hypothetical protein FRC01_004864 [Tulasnella sp. 417]|nr:hypothetical protein FRC01_004864 [Tulasnella sp. 417]
MQSAKNPAVPLGVVPAMLFLHHIISYRLSRSDLLMLSQCVLIADAQAILTITVATPHPNSQFARKLALISMVVTLVAIIIAMLSTDVDIEAQTKMGSDIESQSEKSSPDAQSTSSSSFVIGRSMNFLGFGILLLALVLFIIATAAIPIV